MVIDKQIYFSEKELQKIEKIKEFLRLYGFGELYSENDLFAIACELIFSQTFKAILFQMEKNPNLIKTETINEGTTIVLTDFLGSKMEFCESLIRDFGSDEYPKYSEMWIKQLGTEEYVCYDSKVIDYNIHNESTRITNHMLRGNGKCIFVSTPEIILEESAIPKLNRE
jgi:hypothetical protein